MLSLALCNVLPLKFKAAESKTDQNTASSFLTTHSFPASQQLSHRDELFKMISCFCRWTCICYWGLEVRHPLYIHFVFLNAPHSQTHSFVQTMGALCWLSKASDSSCNCTDAHHQMLQPDRLYWRCKLEVKLFISLIFSPFFRQQTQPLLCWIYILTKEPKERIL